MNIHLNALSFAKQTLSREILTESFKTALFVGIILNIINNGSSYSYGEDVSGPNILLNFAIPFLVSTYSSARAAYIACGKTTKKSNTITASQKNSTI